ncbi:DUF5787 family protein [Haloarchaeobius amylolyticus]|uniref:DUF5787 family protein n=1 Tax=Haloarchaeobius amylolyticus TaxID=1198296 RepID=UPI0022719A2C|nr:DUF5787 family protein [Haloarchaeobius amylolyticus]
MLPGEDTEFGFELRVCRWAERSWPPGSDTDDAETDPIIVARQLGTKRRRWDTIVVECDPDGLRQRANFGHEALDSDLLHVVQHAPEEWTYYRDCLPEPGYPWRYVREAIHRASTRGVIEERKEGNRIQIRRKWAYPDWVRRIIAIENKPDLDASAADALVEQVQYDVALKLADEVWVASRETGETVEPVLLEGMPVQAGILTVDPEATDASVAWHARRLPVDDPGTMILDRPDGGDFDASAAEFRYADPEWKAGKRLAIAERAYERGWRSFADTMRPDCRYFELREDGPLLPWCAAKERCQTAGECSGRCPDFQPEPPAWRTKGWPIEGGPGTRLKRLLAARRRRQRPGLE